MSVDTTERALRLLALLSSRRGWQGPELADRLGVTERTLRRDIERLRLLGYRIDGTRGTAGGYELAAGADVPPLFLDDDEAMAVVAALLLAVGNRSTGMAEASARALGKLHHVLPGKVFRRVAAFQGSARTVPVAGGPAVAPAVVAALAEAVRDRRQVRFSYRTRDGRAGPRRIEPHSLVTPGRVWYLVAYDLDRDDWRLFRVDRIDDVTVTGHGAAPRELPGGDPAAFLGAAIARTPLGSTCRSAPTGCAPPGPACSPTASPPPAGTAAGSTSAPTASTTWWPRS